MTRKHLLTIASAAFVGFVTPSFSEEILFCSSFESCPSGLPSDINPAYLNAIVKDASGRVLGSGPTGEIINEKGYVFSVSRPTGLLNAGGPIYYDSPDCSGAGFVSGYNFGGYVFSTTNISGDFDIRYIKKSVGPTYLAQTYKIANPGPGGSCIDGGTLGNFFPVFFNDPEITGVPNDLGSVANPYPVPLSYHRYGSE